MSGHGAIWGDTFIGEDVVVEGGEGASMTREALGL